MKLTSREKEILEYLKIHPMISQDELAGCFDITRSSAAVHISNLMKKGAILGKGYIFQSGNIEPSIQIIGRFCLELISNENKKGLVKFTETGSAKKIKELLRDFGVNIKIINLTDRDEINKITAAGYDYDHEKWLRWKYCYIVQESGFNWPEYYKNIDLQKLLFSQRNWVLFTAETPLPLINQVLGYDYELTPEIGISLFMKDGENVPEFIKPLSLLVLGLGGVSEIQEILNTINYLWARNIIVSDGGSFLYYYCESVGRELLLTPQQKFDPERDLPYVLGGVVVALSSGYNLRQAVRIALGTTKKFRE
jgi:DNA-binding CsgD family transcriptional regulator